MIDEVKTLCAKIEAKGYQVKDIVTDPAKQLAGLQGKLQYNLTTVGSRTHVADAEVEIRILKERLKSTERGLPYNLARRLIRWMVYGCVKACNIVLVAGQTTSPTEHFTGVKPNYKRDFRAEFGEYVQASVAPNHMDKNGPKPRTAGAIALCSTGNDRGTWWFMSIQTKGFFTADRWEALPMPDIVIELLNSLYDSDEPKRGKKRRDANPPQQDNDVAARDEEGEALAALPIVREEPIINADDNDLNEIAEDNAGHSDQADLDDVIPVEAEHDNQAGEESINEMLKYQCHVYE
jgi:hypothetical protein